MTGWKGYIGLIFGWQVTASGCFYAIYAATPFVRSKFGISAALVGVMLTTLTLGYTVCLVPVGSIIDQYGERLTLFIGLIGLGASAVVVAVSPTYLVLLASAFVLGGFYSPSMPGTNKAVFAIVPSPRQNLSMGIKQVGVTAGSGISAVLVPWFGATRFGWETAFLFLACVAVVVSVVFIVTYPRSENGGTSGQLVLWTHFQDSSYVILIAGGFFLGAGLYSTIGYTILYVETFADTTTVFAGVVLAIAQITGSAGRIVSGWLVDTLQTSLSVSAASILVGQAAATTVLFVFAATVTTSMTAVIAFGLLGFFILGFTGVYFSCIGGLVDSENMGSATSGAQLALNAGALVSPPAFGYVVDTSGYTYAWLGLAGGSLIATALFATLLFKVGFVLSGVSAAFE